MGRRVQVLILASCILTGSPLLTAQVQNAPPGVAAALLVKLSAFERNVSSAGDVVVYVLGAPSVAQELRKGIGQAIGTSKLTRVLAGAGLPDQRPTVLYVGDVSNLDRAIAYARAHDVLSVTGSPEWVERGVALGIGVGNDGKPKVILNLVATVEENLSWNPAIMKVARTVR